MSGCLEPLHTFHVNSMPYLVVKRSVIYIRFMLGVIFSSPIPGKIWRVQGSDRMTWAIIMLNHCMESTIFIVTTKFDRFSRRMSYVGPIHPQKPVAPLHGNFILPIKSRQA